MKLDQLDLTGYTSFLLKGPYGFGKTIAAASFAKLGPIFLAYWDKKGPIELVQFFKRFAPHLLKNIDYEVYGAHNANEYLNKMFNLSKECRYVAVINDSLTTMTAGAVNWSLGFRDTKDKNKDKIIPSFDEYKVETSLVTQALDICRTLPAHIIWTAHPLPTLKMEGSGPSMKVSKVNSIVTYGSKVAGIVPGQFSEIYHFSKRTDWASGKAITNYYVSTEQVGDEYAKSNIGLSVEMNITDRLFYDVWKEEVQKWEAKLNDVELYPQPVTNNPFANVVQIRTPETTPQQPKEFKKPWET